MIKITLPDGSIKKVKIGTSAIGTGTMLTIDSGKIGLGGKDDGEADKIIEEEKIYKKLK